MAMARRLAGAVGMFKVGSQLFTSEGPQALHRLARLRTPVFLDLKFHDIPNTVAGAVRAAAALPGVALVNLHALGGTAMMRAAAAALPARRRPKLIAVTVLTSMDEEDLAALGMGGGVAEQALRLAALAQECGVDGVVCSAREIERLRRECGHDFLLVVPGIRPAWSSADDQKRIVTPAEAVALGADHIVVGRPITRADDPAEAARRILRETVSRVPS